MTMEDRFMAVDSFIRKQKEKVDGFSIEQCCRMFGVSRSGYYAWKARIEDKDGKQAARKAADDYVKELMRLVIAKLGFVPGKRTFHIHLWRDHGEHVSVKRCRRLMKEMNLTASRPKKDAYKHQATHDHECASPVNAVNQNFYIGPRKIILTDITYLYYGPNRTVFYLCVFGVTVGYDERSVWRDVSYGSFGTFVIVTVVVIVVLSGGDVLDGAGLDVDIGGKEKKKR
jgi:transposase